MNGKIISISPDTIDVKFSLRGVPAIGTILRTKTGAVLSTETIVDKTTIRAIVLSQLERLSINEVVTSTGKPLMAPVGKHALGRIFNVLGEPIDQKEDKVRLIREPVSIFKKNEKGFSVKEKILETGIKAIDFFIPIVQGDKIGLFGGAGVGKTLVIKELINNVTKAEATKDAVSIMTGIGERSREGEELYRELKEAKLINKVMLYFAQMNETPGARMKIIYPAITSAEYFRDVEEKNVLMFMDNIYRFTQAGSELSSSLGRIPSQSGYQPTLMTEISNVQERLSNSQSGSITSFQTVFVPADDITDPAAVAVFSHLDGSLVLDRRIAAAGRYPAIDPLQSSSNNLQESLVGERHLNIVLKAKKILQRFDELEDLLAILGTDGISKEDLTSVKIARQLQAFFTQNFFTAEEFTQKKGDFVPLEETLSSVEAIINEELIDIKPEEFLYIKGVDELLAKAKKDKEQKSASNTTPSKREMKLIAKKNKKANKKRK